MHDREVTRFTRGAALVFSATMLLLAIAIHVATSLPASYSWTRTLELFRDALLDTHFVVFAMIATLSGVASRGKGVLLDWLVGIIRRPSPGALVLACLGTALTLFSGMVHAYSVADLVLLPVLLFLLLHLFDDRRVLPVGISILVGVSALVVVSYVFTIIKSQLFVVGTPRDAWVVAAESAVFGSPFYRMVADWAVQTPWAVALSDWVYFLFFHHIALVALFLFSRADRIDEIRYFIALCACYLIGVLSYFLMPTLGPVYFDPGSFAYVRDLVSFTPMIQDFLRSATEAAVNGQLKTIETYAFIAGMPSLHMAHETVMLHFSRRSRAMFAMSLVFWAGSFISVLVLGWHYLFEALAGLLLACMALAVAARVAGSPQRLAGKRC